MTFGWQALREKLRLAEYGLDDIGIELCKAALRGSGMPSPIGPRTELRLLDVRGVERLFGWVDLVNGEELEQLSVVRSLYEQCTEGSDDAWAWQELREALGRRPFVDLNRLLLAAES